MSLTLFPRRFNHPLPCVRASALLLVGAFATSAMLPGAAWAAGPGGQAHYGPILVGIAVMVLAAKLGGLLAERIGQPPVLGELVAGIGLANVLPLFAAGGIASVWTNPAIQFLAEMGVLLLLFDVGLETDIRALARVGLSSLTVAFLGVAAPFALGWAASAWMIPASSPIARLFVSATLTATSVGITMRVLRDLNGAQTPEGQTILGAAILDDILGLVVLAVVSGMATAAATGGEGLSGLGIALILFKAALFLGITVITGTWLSAPLIRLVGRSGHTELLLIVGVALCFALAAVAEAIGLAGIIGAFAAGLLLDPYGEGVRTAEEAATLSTLMHPLSAFLVPLFFVLMGVQVDLRSFADPAILRIGAVLIFCAIAGKLVSGLGVTSRGVNRLAVAIGMVPRGEVGLIFAGIGAAISLDGRPLLDPGMFSAVVLMVLVTTLLTPPGLRWAFARSRRAPEG